MNRGYSPWVHEESVMTDFLPFPLSSFSNASQVALVVKNSPASAGDIRQAGFILGPGRSPGGRHGNSLQDFCLEKPIDRGAWQAMVYGVTKSWPGLSN